MVQSLYTVQARARQARVDRTGWSLVVVSQLVSACVVTTENNQHTNTPTLLTHNLRILNIKLIAYRAKQSTDIFVSQSVDGEKELRSSSGARSSSRMLSSGVMMLSLVTAAMSDGSSPVLSSATHLRRDFSVFSHNKKVKLGHM